MSKKKPPNIGDDELSKGKRRQILNKQVGYSTKHARRLYEQGIIWKLLTMIFICSIILMFIQYHLYL